ncbi:hypothetical protein ABMA28_017227 [Loxostege sticticalis]|uniref:NADP-dependent oxidoreductase domain-containing protein n=1 Tax=Loxostege sticticalis TaxID=481309 RepID=A0ABD0S272_LOXSC
MFLLVFLIAGLLANSFADDKDGGKAPSLQLNDGNTMPQMGYSFGIHHWDARDPNYIETAVTKALDAGYRLIDTAAVYGTEEQVGRALQKTTVPREHIFLVTKLAAYEKHDVVLTLRKSLERLNQTYVDMYMIASPVSFTPDKSAFEEIDYADTWRGMVEAKTLGLTRSIGLANFNITQVKRLLELSHVKPSVLDVEINLNLAQYKLVEYCKQNDIVVMAHTPLGRRFDHDTPGHYQLKDDPTLRGVAEKYGKTTSQVIYRYLIQRGLVPIAKLNSKTLEDIATSIDIFDFTLSDNDMKTLNLYNENYRSIHPKEWLNHPYYPFVDNS